MDDMALPVDLEQVLLPPTQYYGDAELDVFTQNMLQCEGLVAEEILEDLFLDPSLDPTSPNPAPQQQANYHVQLHAKQVPNLRGPPSSVFSSENSTRLNSGGSSVGDQDTQQQYAAMYGGLMPAAGNLTYPPTGPMTGPPPPLPKPVSCDMGSNDGSGMLGDGNGSLRALGSAEGSGVLGNSDGPLGPPQGSTEGITVNGTPRSDSMTHSGGGGGTSGDRGVSSGMHTNSFGTQSSGPEAATSDRAGSPFAANGAQQDGSSGGEAERAAGAGLRSNSAASTKGGGRNMGVLREKHRSAQRRYRERLRAKHDEAGQHVEELTRQLNALKASQSQLQQRNQQLEAHIAAQSALPASPNSVQPPPIPSPTPPPLLGPSDSHPSPQSASTGQSALFEQPSRSNRYKLNDQTWDLIKDSVGAIDDKLTFTVEEGKPVAYTRRELSEFTTTQYKDLWKKYVNGFAHCLMLCNGNEQSPAYPRLLMLLAETRALKLTFCMLRPDLLSAWAQYAAEQRGMPTAAFWRGIADSLTVSPQQLHNMILVRNQALRNLGAMMAQRRELLASLSNGTEVTVQLEDMTSIDALQTKTAAQRMDALLRNENSFIAEISTVVTEDVLTPLQLAHVITLAWPFGVNIMSIMNCLAARVGAPPVAEMLRQGAAAGGASLSPLRQALIAE